MESSGQNTDQAIKQTMEDNDVLKQLMELLDRQGMGRQSQDFMELIGYVAGMQNQLGEMLGELQSVRQELSRMQETQPKLAAEGLVDKVGHLQEKVTDLSERLSAVKDHLAETAAQAVSAFKEKGRAGMNRVLQKGISGVKKMLMDYLGRLADVMADYQKTISRIDSIGDELKQIGNSVSNVGRLITGKDAKEVSDEKPGVGLTRLVNRPMKKAVENLRKKMDTVDKAVGKLDRLSDRFDSGKEAEEGRASVKGKLSQMKAKADQQKKAPKPDKARDKAECL